MKIQIKGIIIKETNLGESDKSVKILTAEFGIINAIIKRCKSFKNKNSAKVQLLSYCQFSVYTGKSAYIIDECEIIELFWGVQQSLRSLALAQYFCELTIALRPEIEVAKDYLKLILNSLYYLSTNKLDQKTIKFVFEMRACAMCGYMPDITGCCQCKNYNIDDPKFLINSGVIMCKKCLEQYSNSEKSVFLSRSLLSVLRHVIYSPVEKVFNFKISDSLKESTASICEEYITAHLGDSFKALKFYKTIS